MVVLEKLAVRTAAVGVGDVGEHRVEHARGAINVGQPDGVHTSQHFGNCLECIRSVVVEDNTVRLRRAENGTCEANAVVVHAAHTVARNNSCAMVP